MCKGGKSLVIVNKSNSQRHSGLHGLFNQLVYWLSMVE